MFRLQRVKHFLHIRGGNKLRESEIEPVGIGLDTDCRAVAGGKKDG